VSCIVLQPERDAAEMPIDLAELNKEHRDQQGLADDCAGAQRDRGHPHAARAPPGFLDEFLDFEDFGAQVGRCSRTIERWTQETDGLPYTWLGNTRLIHVPTAREWVLSRMRYPNRRRAGKSNKDVPVCSSTVPDGVASRNGSPKDTNKRAFNGLRRSIGS
jgi:hypothetical protein